MPPRHLLLIRSMWNRWALLALTLLVSGCRPAGGPAALEPAEPGPWLSEITQEAGIDFVHDAGPLPGKRYLLPQIAGSGAALFDYDGDGRLDIYLIHNGGPKGKKNQLFRQDRDGRFIEASAGSGLDVAGYGMGAAIGDIDNDGRPDLVLTEYGRTRLFRNEGNGRFTDISAAAGIDNPLWGTSAAFLDYDRDGWLDLVVANYVEFDPSKPCLSTAGELDYCGPLAYNGSASRLYHNRGRGKGGEGPRFADVSVASGLAGKPGPGLGVLCADFNADRWPDILIANDGKPNHLWINQHDGSFKEEAVERGIGMNRMGHAEANMGIALGDVDGDGLFDIFVTHLTEETHTLWKQGPAGMFQDRTAAAGLAGPAAHSTGFGALLADLDNDGALDLAVVNGRVRRGRSVLPSELPLFWRPYAEQNLLLAGDGSGRFVDRSASNPALCGSPGVYRALVAGDLDNDGFLDLVVTAIAGPARLLRNVAPRSGHWLIVRAVDPAHGGRDAYGAEVRARAGARQWWRLIQPGHGYLCSHDPRAHVGLGPVEAIDRIEVLWPDGSEERFPGGPVDRMVELRQGEGSRP